MKDANRQMKRDNELIKSKKPDVSGHLVSLNMAPLTGIAFASNWLINRLNLNSFSVKTTRMTTNLYWLGKTNLATSQRSHFAIFKLKQLTPRLDGIERLYWGQFGV